MEFSSSQKILFEKGLSANKSYLHLDFFVDLRERNGLRTLPEVLPSFPYTCLGCLGSSGDSDESVVVAAQCFSPAS